MVSAKREHRLTKLIAICSLKGGKCDLLTDIPLKNLIMTSDKRNLRKNDITAVNGKTRIACNMQKGETIYLKYKTYIGVREITPVAGTRYLKNYWGLKKRKTVK